ncbi:hypothetical protein PC117_g16622 [Phytophthora cactorum]|uniref:Uncharacterized protein n=1 Tax=Phytophthora cactorum TaxID=29920 RepID=A0A8T1C9Y2_9STRA|nr:hypothetical protein PC117_g16622 [Phytophthora cactorum]
MPRLGKKKRELSSTSSPPSQPLTRSSTSATRPEAEPSMSVVDISSLLQPALGGAAAASAFTVPPDDNPFAAFAVPTLRLLDDSNSTQQTSRRSLASQPALPSPPTPSTRDGRTKIYYQGVQGVAWVKNKIKQRCEAHNVPYSRSKWNQFWNYFQKTWIETFPPDLWNIYGVQQEIVNRTNNSLERFHREVNARLKRQPSLRHLVKTIEEIARHYQILRKSIITGDTEAPKRPGHRFPRAATLPSIADIQDSESEDESDSDSIDDNNNEEYPQVLDEDLEFLYDVCPEQEEVL